MKIAWWGIENRDGIVEVEAGGRRTVRRVRARGRERGEGIVAGRKQIDVNEWFSCRMEIMVNVLQ